MNTPFYITIVNDLRDQIVKTERYKPGDEIPSIRELSYLYEASPTTIKKAIDELKKEGLLIGYQGRGVYVSRTIKND